MVQKVLNLGMRDLAQSIQPKAATIYDNFMILIDIPYKKNKWPIFGMVNICVGKYHEISSLTLLIQFIALRIMKPEIFNYYYQNDI